MKKYYKKKGILTTSEKIWVEKRKNSPKKATMRTRSKWKTRRIKRKWADVACLLGSMWENKRRGEETLQRLEEWCLKKKVCRPPMKSSNGMPFGGISIIHWLYGSSIRQHVGRKGMESSSTTRRYNIYESKVMVVGTEKEASTWMVQRARPFFTTKKFNVMPFDHLHRRRTFMHLH